ncbi:TPA: HAMP domain-containing histidine kinase [bacterium]|nr:HAMP domain-containing histidine kinase [bacterium]
MLKTFKLKIFLTLFFVSSIALSTGFFIRHYLIEEINKYLEGKREDSVYILIGEIEKEFAKNLTFENIDRLWLADLEARLHIKFVLKDEDERTIYPIEKTDLSEFQNEYPLFYNRKQIGIIKIRFDKEERLEVLIDRSEKILISALFVSVIVIIILSISLSDKISKPIKELTKGAIEVSNGNLNIDINIKSNDEIGRLSKEFKEMIKKLKLLEDIRRRNVANLSHEIRTPLTVIKGNLMAILDGVIKNDDSTIKSLLEEVDKLERITEDIKTLADIDSSLLKLNLEDVNIKDLTLKLVNNITPLLLEKNLTINTEIEDLIIKADRQLYSQLLLNLLTNAIKASKEGDNIEIKIDSEKKELIIRDFGVGIDDKDINFIFERFYKKFKDGSGIGLSIVKDIAIAHNWNIKVNSRKNMGTEFIIKFKNS